ncbi:uncharacterized protein LOC125833775 [Solanum verrucosum]|uniref:uncharacterized protein LOC125809880 n=1 Tax=Solanum verrucosum TaxID=315347 RepID=UPI0020D1D2F5|nr:uncharacterized protein LOC125809880 [Solanum verrucosum]XP_049368915.1 uncharacterized protein LOC125833775 [Solanum verrucosum]
MSNLSKLEFVALDISGNNYLSWVLNVEIHLDAKGLGATITNGNTTSSQDKAKAMIFLRHHLNEGLKVEYLMVKDPLELWTGLKERYDHLKTTQQYRERGFKKYFELISCLLVAEQHNTLLLKNHEACPTGTAPLPEANEVEAHGQSERRQNKNQGQNNVCGRGNDRGRYNNRRGGGRHKRENNMGSQSNPSRGNCHRCGMKGHWKNECRAAEHFVRLYQDSLKIKGNKNGASSSNARVESHLTYKNDAEAGPSQKYDDNIEANLALKDDNFGDLDDIIHLEVEDFFGDQN